MLNYGRERLDARFSITIDRSQYLELKNFSNTNHFKNAQFRGFMRNYEHELLTQGLKYTSHLKIVPLIGFMRNYRHEQFSSRTSWVTCNSVMIINIISQGIRNSILRTWRYYSSRRYSTNEVHAEVMDMNNSTQGSKYQ